MSGAQDDTAVDGHVDRYLDGTIQWTFVSPILDMWSPKLIPWWRSPNTGT